jgi:hypothetical protein
MSFVLTGTSDIIGTKDSLPHDVAEIAILRSEVIVETTELGSTPSCGTRNESGADQLGR